MTSQSHDRNAPHEVSDALFSFTPTSLLVASDDVPRQVCRLTIHEPNAEGDATLRIRRGDVDLEFPFRLAPGSRVHEIQLPEVQTQRRALVELVVGEHRWSTDVTFSPVRRWQVFFVNHSHTDIGFTHTPSAVVDVHNKNLTKALEFAEATESWPTDVRFRWTCESAWQVQNFLRDFPDERPRLTEALEAGSVEIEALYIHSYFDLLSREQLVRSLTFAQHLRNEMDAQISSAMISDVPGCPWSFVDLLVASGVRYLSMAPNNFLAPFHATTDLPRPFYWQGPAGGRVLVWYTDDPYRAYIEGANLGFWEGMDVVEQKLPAKLDQLESDGYPFDAVQIQLGSDNRPLRLLPATIARAWNQTYLSPKLRVATPSEFFRHAEERWSDRLPVASGEWQSSWSQTTLHYPHEAGASRRNHNSLDLWERMAVIADLTNEAFLYPSTQIGTAYDASLLFDEHSGPKGIWRPHSSDEAIQALREGYQIFKNATVPAEQGFSDAQSRATGSLSSGEDPEVVVWNLLSWPRNGLVEASVPAHWISRATAVIDDTSMQSVPFETISKNDAAHTCRIQVRDVPAMGYKRYRISSDAVPASNHDVNSGSIESNDNFAVLENEALSMTVDAGGHITQLFDKRSELDLVDNSSRPGLNAFVRYVPEPNGPEEGGDFHSDTRLYEGIPIQGQVHTPSPTNQDQLRTERTLGRVTASTEQTFDGLYRWQTEISLLDDWIEVNNRLSWLDTPSDPEVLYVLFPFNVPEPVIRHASQYAVVDPKTQTLSGSSHDSFAIQHWLDLSTISYGVTLHSSDLALADYGGINHLHFLRNVDTTQGGVGFRIASVRTPPQQSESPFGKQECLELRFAFRPYSGSFDPLAAHDFGESQAIPLQAEALSPRHPGFWSARSGSFVNVDGQGVMVTGLKKAEIGNGYIVRVWESTGYRRYARLTFPEHELLDAWESTPVENDVRRLDPVNEEIRFELSPFQTATFRCVLGR